MVPPKVTIDALEGIPMIAQGDDLAAHLCASLDRAGVEPKASDVLVVAQKVVSKAEGRDTFVITGFIFTSCVRAAVLGFFRHGPGNVPDRVIVPLAMTGSRLSSHSEAADGASRVQAIMRELSAVGAFVTPSDRLDLAT